MQRVVAIWYRKLTDGDFFNIERLPGFAGPMGGGGQTYVDIPGSLRRKLFQFFEIAEPGGGVWPPITKTIAAIGAPGVTAPLRFELNRQAETRYRIARQIRQRADSERHPAWTDAFGFPRAPDDVQSPAEAATYLPAGGVRMFLVRTEDGALYAGHTHGSVMPPSWPVGVGLDELFDPRPAGGLRLFGGAGPVVYLDPTDANTPFVTDADWSPEETAVLLDVYVEQGPQAEGSEAVRDAGDRIAAIGAGHHRTPAAIASRLNALEGFDPTTDAGMPPDDAARTAWDVFGSDTDALHAAVEIGDQATVDLGATAADAVVQKTTVEAGLQSRYRTRGTAPSFAERREQRLVLQFAEYLEALGHEVTAHTYLIPGYPLPLRCDLFDETEGLLVEAKGAASRERVRMAIGQLLDYRRFEPESPKLAVLLPWRPSADLLDLIHSVDAIAIWKEPDGFGRSDVDGGDRPRRVRT